MANKYVNGANLARAFNKMKALISTKANADLTNVDNATLKTKVEAAGVGITVDTALSNTSTNPVQNKVVASALADKAASNHDHTASEVGALAKEGGTLSGNLKISKANSPEIEMVVGGDNGYTSMYQHGGTLNISSGMTDDSDDTFIVLQKPGTDPSLLFRIGTTIGGVVKRYKLYGEHNKPTAEELGVAASEHNHDDAYMKKSGGTLTGELIIEANTSRVTVENPNAGGRYGRLTHWANGDVEIQNKNPDGLSHTSLMLKAEDANGLNFLRAIQQINGTKETYDVIHTGNVGEHAAELMDVVSNQAAAAKTDYTTSRIRAISLHQNTAPSTLANGAIAGVYEIA